MKEIAAVFIAILIAASSPARIITVDNDGPADFSNIQAAINDANNGDTIEIKPGTYTGPGNRDIDFLGKAITVRSTDPTDPNTVAQTIISGDAFIFQSGEDANSLLEGLTISPGGIYCSGTAPTIRNCIMTDNHSSAVFCQDGSSPMITNCVFTSNWDSIAGGAIYCKENCNLVINDCLFADNEAEDGGAIYCCMDSTLTIYRCVFQENLATDRYGGAIRIKESKATIVDSTFLYNQAGDLMWPGLGGALLCSGYLTELTVNNSLFIGNSSNYAIGALGCAYRTRLTNCIFAGNYSRDYGASLAGGGSGLTIENCTFVANYSGAGSSLALYGPTRIENSIIWDGPDSVVIEDDSTLLVAFSDVQGMIPGYRNINADPCFVDPGRWVDSRDPNIVVEPNHPYAYWVNGDYHLKSQAGRWDPNEGLWTIDEVTSPCIDAGDPNTPIGYEPFPNGGRVNMGVRGGTAEASKSYFGKPTCETIVAGDINGDCVVNGLDFTLMASHWLGRRICPDLPSSPNPPDHAVDVPVTQLLTWRPSCDATYYYVRFGETPSHGPLDTPMFDPGTLEYNTTYYWHVWEFTPEGPITGPTWTFQTPFRRDPASNPDPYDGETDVDTDIDSLTWTPGIGAESHDVYFGDTNPPAFRGNQTSTYFYTHFPVECNHPRCPSFQMEFSTTYYWRIDEVNPYGTTIGALWTFRTGCPPSQAADPNPPDDANNVGASAILTWTADPNATSQKVYFGTTNPPEYQGSRTAATFSPASLAPATIYYWRIDQINSFGTTTGEVWTFTTGTTPPGQATDPNPADDANNLNPGIILSWSPGSDAKSHDVYFGTSSPGTFKRNQTGTTYNPGSLSPGTTYYWRIDEVGWFGTTTGAVWTFTTGPLPEPPTDPDPADGTIGLGLNPILNWTGGAGAESYDIYFGTMSDYKKRGNQTGTTFNPGTLSPGTQYYWRIGEISRWGTTYGPEWTFITQAAK